MMKETTMAIIAMSVLLAGILLVAPAAAVLNGKKIATLFHYTNLKGRNGILSNLIINKSTRESLRYGPGVYLTTLSPADGKKAVGTVCYGKYYGRMVGAGRLDYAFQVQLPLQALEEVREGVYVYRGDLNLGDYKYDLIESNWPKRNVRAQQDQCVETANGQTPDDTINVLLLMADAAQDD